MIFSIDKRADPVFLSVCIYLDCDGGGGEVKGEQERDEFEKKGIYVHKSFSDKSKGAFILRVYHYNFPSVLH